MHASVSATSYQGVAVQCLARIAEELGREDLKGFFMSQNEELKQLVNQYFWDAPHGVYNDLDEHGRPITELQPGVFCKHVHMFWPLMAGFATARSCRRHGAGIAEPRLVQSPHWSAQPVGRQCRIQPRERAVLAWRRLATHPMHGAGRSPGRQATWRTSRNLRRNTIRACVADYQNQKTLRENMAPDKILGCGQPDFVGWAGIGPVANLIEYVLGFEIDAPGKIITWTIRQDERHGLRNLRFNEFKVDLIAEPASGDGLRQIAVESGGEFLLRLRRSGRIVEERIVAGTRTIVIP